ncbi:MAG: NAD(P)/FAD-dependent oxidoreductase [Alphaproteobacteria bacterium]|nr:NAD(P)/FAD-dependent oxidoreductase [Alphaproteobacteria bacterium]MDE2109835.1 NAD(P)/FAD-dependent oxidoreductase [Alphaproteobacteria bacterium]MDE2493519.1 NAD(P)/FAD-dependent oxidoreductase [Alphaproteobacteria bacterium]
MADIVVLGAGLGGTLMAYELVPFIGPSDRLTVIGQDPLYHFVPSNPWVAIGWRQRAEVEIDLNTVMARKRIKYHSQGAKRLHPKENRVELNDGSGVPYDYLVIATGPDLAFDEIIGLGPVGHTQSVCHVDHAERAHAAFEEFVKNPAPIVVGAVQGASCFGPAYEFAFILDAELRKRKLRDKVPMTFVTSEPYIGHLGLDGVGDTKGLLENQLRERHIKWIVSARVRQVDPGKMTVEEVGEDGAVRKTHELSFGFSMMLPAFRGVKAVLGLEGLTNPRGFIVVDKKQRNPAYPNIFAVGVCVAIPPVGPTPVPVGVPKTGFMIESMVTATAHNIGALMKGAEPADEASWNAVCLADFGDGGVAFVAQPQIPPRNLNWSSKGRWVHYAKIAYEKYFMHKVRSGESEPFYERWAMEALGVRRLRRAR